ncbi:DUF2089 family protein [Mucisphaera sp.]|uniref:DUF2089 family protein n=1 Tax=Mucisphaera sp. TaxID=2913024 RepID=UPI003D0A6BE1
MTKSQDHPLQQLSREDQDLILSWVLHSGSLKGLAEVYGVSYPTIRARVDRVIERLEAIRAGRRPSPVAEYLAGLVERGEMSPAAAREVLRRVREETEASEEGTD